MSNNNYSLKKETKKDIFLIGITCIELYKGPLSNESRLNLIEKLSDDVFNFEDLYFESEFSSEFYNFLKICLNHFDEKRPTAYKLISH